MPDFRVVYVSDGACIANVLADRFSKDKYKLAVELHDLHRRSAAWSSQALSPSSSPGDADDNAAMTVLVASPAMLTYLDDMVQMNKDRTWLTDLIKSDQPPVALICHVEAHEVNNQIEVFFNNEFTWRHLEVGLTRESFLQCQIQLVYMLEGRDDMPVPTLKKYHLLSDKPVLAHDTMYIHVGTNLVGSNAMQSLRVIFKDGHEVTATHVAYNIYQFEAPESSESSRTIEVFTSEGESLGTDIIRYRDKLQVFADVYNDLLNLAKVQSPQANEEVEAMIADWLTSNEKLSSEGDIQKLLVQGAKSIKLDKNDVHLTLPLMPLFVYLCTKYNQNTLAQLLLGHLGQLAKVDPLFKEESLNGDQENEYEIHGSADGYQENEYENHGSADGDQENEYENHGSADGDQENEYENHGSAEFFFKDEDDASSSSGSQEDYVCADEIVIENRYHDADDNDSERKVSTVSAFIPRTTPHSCAREPLSKSCPPECGKHGHMSADAENPHYENISVCEGLKAEASRYTFQDSSASKGFTEPQLEKPASLSVTQESPRAVVNERPVQDKKDRSILPEPSAEEIKPALPPRRSSNISKQHNTPSSTSLRRLSLASLVPRCSPPSSIMSSSTLSLTKLCDSKPNLYGQSRVDSPVRMLPGKSPLSSSTLSLPRLCEQARVEYSTRVNSATSPSGDTKLPPIPSVLYSTRPSPPIPKSPYHRMDNIQASDGVCLRDVKLGRQQSMPAAEEESCCPENISRYSPPDYSQPINLCFEDGQPNGFRISGGYAEHDEIIYERIDETLEIFQDEALIEAAAIYDVPRKGIHRSVSADVVPASPQSPVPTSPISPDPPASQKKSSRSPIWSSFKLSLKKPGKSKRLNTKL